MAEEKPKKEKEAKKPKEEKPEETLEKKPEGKEAKKESPEIRSAGNLLSPTGIMLFSVAGVIDGIGLIILCTGLDDLGIMDIIGLIFVGGLMFATSGSITGTKGAQKTVKKLGTKLSKRLGLSFLGELIPYFGGIAPCWTLAVYFHLKGG